MHKKIQTELKIKTNFKLVFIYAVFALLAFSCKSQNTKSFARTTENIKTINREHYISNFDLKWDKAPGKWEEGAFNGNGRLGVMVWKDYSGGLRFDLGAINLYKQKSRIPVGKFVMNFKGEIKDFQMTQHLYTSEITGKITTTQGVVNFLCYIDGNIDEGNIITTTEGNETVSFRHIPLPPALPNPLRTQIKKIIKPPRKTENDLTNPLIYPFLNKIKRVNRLPKDKLYSQKNVNIREVHYDSKSGYFLLWKKAEKSNKTRFTWSLTPYAEKTKLQILNQELANIINYQEQPQDELTRKHRLVWADYFNGSLISIPNKMFEANYWIELYKIRAATRKGEYPIDLLGPWFRSTPWPRIWCNLNIQLTYPIAYQAGKKEVAATLFDFMDKHKQQFINAVPEKYHNDSAATGRGWSPADGTGFWGEYGNFLWMLFTYKEFLEYFPNPEREKEQFYPMLKRGLNFIIHNLKKDTQGIYHFPEDISPEYVIRNPFKNKFPDTNYNIAFTLWGLNVAINLAKQYNDTDALKKYQEIKDNLVQFQINQYGYMVAKDTSMDILHRHFSHLAAFYPIGLLDINEKNNYELAVKSVQRWLSCPRLFGRLAGYTFTGASAMYSRLHQPDNAVKYLDKYLRERATPNTFYLEAGPCIESPLHSASATLEILLQSISLNEAQVFLGVPKTWKQAFLSSLPVKGGHKISALLKDGKIYGINLTAAENAEVTIVYPEELGNSLLIKSSIKGKNIKIEKSMKTNLTYVKVKLQKNEEIIIGKKINLKDASNLVDSQKQFNFGLNENNN